MKQNQSDSAGFSQSLHTSMQTEDSWETLIPVPCYSRSHILSEAPHEKLWAFPLLFILELDASTSLLEDERLYLTSNLNFFMIRSYSFVLMSVLAFSLNGFLFLDVLLTFVICYHQEKSKISLLNPDHLSFKCHSTVTSAVSICNQIGCQPVSYCSLFLSSKKINIK